jgi:hypothetical protein
MTTHTLNPDVSVVAQDYHRNGVGGAGFVVSLFQWRNQGDEGEPRLFVGVSFFPDYKDDGRGTREAFREHTAVLDLGLLTDGCIEISKNSWRGADHVGPTLATAWQEHDPSYDPFEEENA